MTMQDFTTYCTAEQTKRAYKLGAPVMQQNPHLNLLGAPITEIGTTYDEFGKKMGKYYNNPTTQQMISWLREIGMHIMITPLCASKHAVNNKIKFAFFAKIRTENIDEDDIRVKGGFEMQEQAELAAIDAALDYLKKGGNQ